MSVRNMIEVVPCVIDPRGNGLVNISECLIFLYKFLNILIEEQLVYVLIKFYVNRECELVLERVLNILTEKY